MFLQSFWLDLVSPWPSGLPPGLQIFPEKHAKIGFWKHGQEKTHENTWFCTREPSKPRFLQHFLVAKMSSLRILLVRLPFRGASWALPSPATKSPFPYESFNSREPFSQCTPKSILAGRNCSSGELQKGSEARKIRDSRHVSTPRSAQNLAKYVIHAMFRCFEAFKTSQNT